MFRDLECAFRALDMRDTRVLNSRFMSQQTIQPDQLAKLLGALSEQLRTLGASYELVVIGGAALAALGLVRRPTRDVDVVALRAEGAISPADPFPEPLVEAVKRVASDFGLGEGWLNPGPTADLVRLGLPEGFEARMITRSYGPPLTVHFAGRLDQIHLKLYAMVDQGVGRHEDDLKALDPSSEELLAAARWARTHDPSEGFRGELMKVIAYLGVQDADVD